MSHRICFVGDSHMAAIKLGWDAIAPQHPQLECSFFGSAHKRGADMDDLVLRDGALIPTTADLAREIGRVSDGKESLRLSDFDVIGIVGLQFAFTPTLSLLRRYRPYSMMPLDKRCSLVSRPFMRQTIRERLEQTTSLNLLRKIRSSFSGLLLIIPSPLPAEARIAGEPWNQLPREPLVATIGDVHGLYQSAASHLAADEDALLVTQPSQTMVSRGLSRNEFTRGAIRLEGRLDQSHPEDNVSHMNTDYGVLILGELFTALATRQFQAS